MKKPRIIQNHHAVYGSPEHPEQEWRVPIFMGEHELLGKMNLYSRKTVSRGFLQCLKYFILRNEDRAIDLGDLKKEIDEKSIKKSNEKIQRACRKWRSIPVCYTENVVKEEK